MNSISWNLLHGVKTLYFPSASSEQFSTVRRGEPVQHMMWKPPSQMAEAEQKFFFLPFPIGENQAFTVLQNQDSNSLGTVSLKKKSKGNSISFGTEQSEKQRKRLRSLLGDLNQTKLEEIFWRLFLWDNFLVLLSMHNSKHSQGNWMLQMGSKQIVLTDTASTQVQTWAWRPFLPLQQGHRVCSSPRDLTALQKGDALVHCPEPPYWETKVKMGTFSEISARREQG